MSFLRLSCLLLLALVSWSFVHAEEASPVAEPEVPQEEELKAHVSHILVASEEEADDIFAQLQQEKVPLVRFGKIAMEISLDETTKAKGGDMGWLTYGEMEPEVAEVAFHVPSFRQVRKVKSAKGWHILYTSHFSETEDPSSWRNTVRSFLLWASPAISPMIILIAMYCGTRASESTIKSGKKGPRARASHVLVNKEEEADEVLKLVSEASDKQKKLAELAEIKSKCPSRKRGGDLSWFGRGEMVKAFDNIVFEKEIGSVHKVKTQFGYHVVMVTDRADGEEKKEK